MSISIFAHVIKIFFRFVSIALGFFKDWKIFSNEAEFLVAHIALLDT